MVGSGWSEPCRSKVQISADGYEALLRISRQSLSTPTRPPRVRASPRLSAHRIGGLEALNARGTTGARSLRRALALRSLYQAVGELQPPEGRALADQALRLHGQEIELLQSAGNAAVDQAVDPELPENPAQLVAELAELADQAAAEYRVSDREGEPDPEAHASVTAEKAAVLRQLAERMVRSPGLDDFTLEAGYRLERVISGLTYPTGVFFDSGDGIYVVEGGFTYGPAKGPARILKVEGDRVSIVVDGLQGPVTGALWHRGVLYTAEGGAPRRISRILPGQERTDLVIRLRSFGDHYTSEFGPRS